MCGCLRRSKTSGIPCRRLTFVWTIRHLGEAPSFALNEYFFDVKISPSEHITWIQEDLLDALKDIPSNLRVDIQVFVSNKSPNSTQNDFQEDPEKLEDDIGSSQKAEQESNAEIYDKCLVSDRLLSLPMIEIRQERADLGMLIKNEVALAQNCMSVNGKFAFS